MRFAERREAAGAPSSCPSTSGSPTPRYLSLSPGWGSLRPGAPALPTPPSPRRDQLPKFEAGAPCPRSRPEPAEKRGPPKTSLPTRHVQLAGGRNFRPPSPGRRVPAPGSAQSARPGAETSGAGAPRTHRSGAAAREDPPRGRMTGGGRTRWPSPGGSPVPGPRAGPAPTRRRLCRRLRSGARRREEGGGEGRREGRAVRAAARGGAGGRAEAEGGEEGEQGAGRGRAEGEGRRGRRRWAHPGTPSACPPTLQPSPPLPAPSLGLKVRKSQASRWLRPRYRGSPLPNSHGRSEPLPLPPRTPHLQVSPGGQGL